MRYCEYCGQLIDTGARFCSSCGAPAPVEETVVQPAVTTYAAAAVDQNQATVVEGSGNYNLIIVSLGSCARAAAADLLEDTQGYSDSEAAELFNMLPAQAAQQLTYQQAEYLAQAMTEYGMQVSVSSSTGYVTTNTDSISSVFNSDGSFLGKVASVLGVITGLNRMKKFRKLNDVKYYEKQYRPAVAPPAPPKHVRRPVVTVRRDPQPVRPQAAPNRPADHRAHDIPAGHTGSMNRPQGGQTGHRGQPGHGGPGNMGPDRRRH